MIPEWRHPFLARLSIAAFASAFVSVASAQVVTTRSELYEALRSAKPGAVVRLAPGDYAGGLHFLNLHGSKTSPITLEALDPSKPPRIVGGGSGLQFSRVSHLKLRNLVFQGASGNGLNIDDGGQGGKPSHHIEISQVTVRDLPPGNHDAMKLSGVEDFVVSNCSLARWGGSGIDMVGCHRGTIRDSHFSQGGDNAIQCKGGSSQIRIRKCRFVDFGQRGINMGGSTGLEFFRPKSDTFPVGARFEATDISVKGCTFVGGVAPFAFVGSARCSVEYNTVYRPGRWVLRILQETTSEGFAPSQTGSFSRNLIVFHASTWSSGGVNIGPNTAPDTFRFSDNFWYCIDQPQASAPVLPVKEVRSVVGIDPQFVDPAKAEFQLRPGSPAKNYGATAWKGDD